MEGALILFLNGRQPNVLLIEYELDICFKDKDIQSLPSIVLVTIIATGD